MDHDIEAMGARCTQDSEDLMKLIDRKRLPWKDLYTTVSFTTYGKLIGLIETRILIIFCHSLINNTLAIMTAEQDIPFVLPPDTTPSQFKEYVSRARLIVGASNVTVITSDAHPDLTGATSYMSPAKAHDMYNILPKTHFLAVRFPLHHSPSSYSHPEHTRGHLGSQYEYRSWRKCREKLQLQEKQKHRLKSTSHGRIY